MSETATPQRAARRRVRCTTPPRCGALRDQFEPRPTTPMRCGCADQFGPHRTTTAVGAPCGAQQLLTACKNRQPMELRATPRPVNLDLVLLLPKRFPGCRRVFNAWRVSPGWPNRRLLRTPATRPFGVIRSVALRGRRRRSASSAIAANCLQPQAREGLQCLDRAVFNTGAPRAVCRALVFRRRCAFNIGRRVLFPRAAPRTLSAQKAASQTRRRESPRRGNSRRPVLSSSRVSHTRALRRHGRAQRRLRAQWSSGAACLPHRRRDQGGASRVIGSQSRQLNENGARGPSSTRTPAHRSPAKVGRTQIDADARKRVGEG